MSGIRTVADGRVEEFERLLPRQRKTQRVNLALLVATVLEVRSASLRDLAAVMAPFVAEVLARAAVDRRGIVLILNQSEVSDRHQMPMLALRHGERTLPLAWRDETTEAGWGHRGFHECALVRSEGRVVEDSGDRPPSRSPVSTGHFAPVAARGSEARFPRLPVDHLTQERRPITEEGLHRRGLAPTRCCTDEVLKVSSVGLTPYGSDPKAVAARLGSRRQLWIVVFTSIFTRSGDST